MNVIITGASKGFGRAVAKVFGREPNLVSQMVLYLNDFETMILRFIIRLSNSI